MTQYADILVYNRNRQPVVIIEAKSKFNTTKEWAGQMRRNMLAHNLLPSAPYFILALPDVFYFWEVKSFSFDTVNPTLQIDPKPFLEPLANIINVSLDRISGQRFELIIATWLNNVLASTEEDLLRNNQTWIVETGLFEKIAGGFIKVAEAA
ncbi:MAG: hypothetical protein JWQ40_1366 [Segetibacter sp.]|nr:hypothetical protein [Segetibacter sp.]